MAQTTGTTNHPLDAQAAGANHPLLVKLVGHPRQFTFYQAIRILERFGGGAPLGAAELPRREALRLRAHDSLSFPPWDVEQIEQEENPWLQPETRYRVTTTFMGLYGPASPLPTIYTDMLLRQQEEEDDEDRARVRAFMDIFNHRFLSFVYRSVNKYRYHLTYEPGARDRFSQFVLGFIGRGTRGMPDDRAVSAERVLRYAGLMTQHPRNASSLAGILRDFFGVAVRVQQCMGRWLRVEDQNRLGGAFCQMGEDLIVGTNVYDRTGKIRVSVGPVGFEAFKAFLPAGRLAGQLSELVRLYLVDELEFDLEVWLKGDEVPPLRMGEGEEVAMLGWTSWAITEPGEDRAVVFAL